MTASHKDIEFVETDATVLQVRFVSRKSSRPKVARNKRKRKEKSTYRVGESDDETERS